MPLMHGITRAGRARPLLVGADGTLLSGGGFQSSENKTTTPLGSAETFTGEWDLNDAPGVMVSCQTDNSGTLYFDFSPDGTNVNTFPTSGFSVEAGVHEFHVAEKGPRYFRVRLVNDSGAQSYLRLYTYFGTYRAPSAPANQFLGLDSDALSVRPTALNHKDYVEARSRLRATGLGLPYGSLIIQAHRRRRPHKYSFAVVFRRNCVFRLDVEPGRGHRRTTSLWPTKGTHWQMWPDLGEAEPDDRPFGWSQWLDSFLQRARITLRHPVPVPPFKTADQLELGYVPPTHRARD